MAGKYKKEKPGKADEPEAVQADGEEGAAPARKKMAGKTLILFIVLPAVLVIGGGGAAAMMLLGGSKTEAAAEEGHEEAAGGHGEAKPKKKDAKKDSHGASAGKDGAGAGKGEAGVEGGVELGVLTVGAEGDPSYYHMPKMIVNLSGAADGDRPLLLELELVLESAEAAAFDEMPAMLPRLIDQFQTFLRELRVEDLNGSAGSYRLRLELLRRFNLVMAPTKIDAVLIEGILIQ
ncbi:MAG: flagellar basal body-associated FliL family protein [Alphaproteobacteria bacterium]|nr:flagellar basal body-associated FliL family protein [Alphaproteobacteria bacterium]